VIAEGCIIGKGTTACINHDNSEQLRQFVQGLPDGPVPFHYPVNALEQDLIAEVDL
jgi:phospholipid/cholesterol/gamma-HCH transport system ATP-binding protein